MKIWECIWLWSTTGERAGWGFRGDIEMESHLLWWHVARWMSQMPTRPLSTWCFCLPARFERSHIQLSGPTTAWGCPCSHLHSGGKNLLTIVAQRALRCCRVKSWVNVNDRQVTRVKSIWPFLCLHRGWKGRGWAGVEMSCYCCYYQCWWLFQISWEPGTQREISVPNTVTGHFTMSVQSLGSGQWHSACCPPAPWPILAQRQMLMPCLWPVPVVG